MEKQERIWSYSAQQEIQTIKFQEQMHSLKLIHPTSNNSFVAETVDK